MIIGSNFVRGLLNDKHQVSRFDKCATGRREILAGSEKDNELIIDDVQPVDRVQSVFEAWTTWFTRALTSAPRSVKDAGTLDEVNAGCTLNVLNAAVRAEVQRVVYASSSAPYGVRPLLPKEEDVALDPKSR